MDADNILIRVLEWAWVALFAMIATMYRKMVGLETQHKLLEQNQANHDRQREEDRAARSEQRESVIDKIDLHHQTVIDKIDTVNTRVDRVERLVRNGH